MHRTISLPASPFACACSAGLGRPAAAQAIPATFLLDRSGRLRFVNLEVADLGRRVAELLEEKNEALQGARAERRATDS